MQKRQLLSMYDEVRASMIRHHNFYIEQAKKRLLSQFDDIEGEAEKYADEHLKKSSQYFDPDKHDEGSFYEDAHDEGILHYEMLDDMLKKTRLSVVSGMFHEWDKEFRDWMVKEDGRRLRKPGFEEFVWKANFKQIIDFLEEHDWPIKSKPYYESLYKCLLIVNVYKHGNGLSFDKIKKHYPEFIRTFHGNHFYLEHANYTQMIIEKHHIDEFSNAIIAFWEDVPKDILEKE